jgi:hypothetical protein
MKKAFIGLLAVLPVLTMANEYHKNLQVFTANTARIPCKTTPVLVYKGDRQGYAQEIAKAKDRAVIGALDGAQLINNTGLINGAVAGLAVFAIHSINEAATSDYEYLYVTECNSGSERTRLMTLVVSNDKLSESKWISIAKKDQARSK